MYWHVSTEVTNQNTLKFGHQVTCQERPSHLAINWGLSRQAVRSLVIGSVTAECVVFHDRWSVVSKWSLGKASLLYRKH